VTESGGDFEALRKSARSLKAGEVKDAFALILTEYFAILGNLTNQVISPSLHSELSQIKFEPKLKVLPRTNGDAK
jgi:hypothetical protein